MAMTIGIIGCGVISNTYIREIRRLHSDTLFIKAVAAGHIENAVRAANKYKIPVACTPDELLANEEIRLVINLTPPDQHYRVNMKILKAGKHLFTEKPFALYLHEAKEVISFARDANLYIGAAPDVFLTAPQQNARLALDSNMVGRPMYATAIMIRHGIEHWHANPFFYYRFGGGPLYDMAPYYLSALINLFGPMKEVYAVGATGYQKRLISSEPHKGEYIDVEVPTHYSGVITMANGVIVSLNMTFDIYKSTLPMLEVYCTEGTVMIPDPNMTSGKVKIFRRDDELKKTGSNVHTVPAPDVYRSVSNYTRGTGVAEMARAITEGRMNHANGEIALHTLDAIVKLIRSAETGEKQVLETTCERPEAMNPGSQ